MDPEVLRFEVAKSRIKWGTYFQNLFRPRFGGGFASYSGAGPSVVATNSRGESRVVATYKTACDAQEGADSIEKDFKVLDADTWCQRYDVPRGFIV